MKTTLVVLFLTGCCLLVSSAPNCNTMCPMNYLPVCGSDGVVYSNECSMNVAACQKGVQLTVQSQEACRTKRAAAAPTCNTMCPFTFIPVCGSDGVTYSNECAMNVAACQRGVQLTVQSQEACRTKRAAAAPTCNTMCPFTFIPVCGSDGVTYSNECAMNVAACQRGTQLTVKSAGSCPGK